jgi:hypothetical protein
MADMGPPDRGDGRGVTHDDAVGDVRDPYPSAVDFMSIV